VNILPNSHFTDVLSATQLYWLADRLPEPKAFTGRPAYGNRLLLPGILKLLRSGCRWRDLDVPGIPSGITHWRRLRFWQQRCRLFHLWRLVLKLLCRIQVIDPSVAVLDGSLIPSFSFADRDRLFG